MEEVRQEVHVGLGSAAAGLVAEGSFQGEALEQQLQIVAGGRVADVAVTGAFLQVGVVACQAGSKGRLGDLRTPQRQQPVAARVGVLQRRRLPFIASPTTPPKKLYTIRYLKSNKYYL